MKITEVYWGLMFIIIFFPYIFPFIFLFMLHHLFGVKLPFWKWVIAMILGVAFIHSFFYIFYVASRTLHVFRLCIDCN